MNTLATPAVASLLDRLFKESDALSPWNSSALSGLSSQERERLMHSKTEYRDLYGRLKDFALPVSRETGSLLYMLGRGRPGRSIMEFGTSFGISTIYLAAALKDNGGGHLITSEFEPTKVIRARENLAAAGLSDMVEFREGDALKTLSTDLPETVDLLLLDGAKALYPEILRLVEKTLKPGAKIVADNADYSPEYLAFVRAPASGYLSIAFGEDVELSMRLS